jgi:hypothetical protein
MMLNLPISTVLRAQSIVDALTSQGTPTRLEIQAHDGAWSIVVSARPIAGADWRELALTATGLSGTAVALEASVLEADGAELKYLGSRVVSRPEVQQVATEMLIEGAAELGLRPVVVVGSSVGWELVIQGVLGLAGPPLLVRLPSGSGYPALPPLNAPSQPVIRELTIGRAPDFGGQARLVNTDLVPHESRALTN